MPLFAAAAPAFGGAVGGSLLAGTVTAAAAPTIGAGIGLGTAAASAGIGSTLMSALPYALMGVSAIGSMQSARSQVASGDSAAANAEYNAKVAEYNASVMEEDAKAAKLSSDYEADKLKREARRLEGRQRALYAKGGVTAEGSPLLVMAEDAGIAAKDIYMTRYSGTVKAQNYNSQANLLRSNASFYRYGGGVAQNTAQNSATGTLLSGLGNMGRTYFMSRMSTRGLLDA